MPQTREIRRRIQSVRNTQQITRAMKMVAAAKLRRAQTRMLAMRPYAGSLVGVLERASYDLFGDEHPLFAPRQERRAAHVVFAGDKGLCGGFNTNILRRTLVHLRESPATDHQVVTVGKRAAAGLRRAGVEPVRSERDVYDRLDYALISDICDTLAAGFLGGDLDAAYVVYNRFESVMVHRATVEKLLPIDFATVAAARRERLAKWREEHAGRPPRPLYEFEPGPEAVIGRLVSRVIATRVYRAALESYAAVLGARMSAMDAATNNAEEMLDRLTMDFNRARQAGITTELLDIVGGAAGLEK